ncbi:MAG TPA: polyprenol phosphomannose-dependent alpha 1,6 mannosyltransferase MptB [Solirubrobacteraceae bacterium]|nr:polyprenol phosphomannose-dependent alpha 1,6 mannosyltransferase MptB [Solirubrobacteraceae bacterium]
MTPQALAAGTPAPSASASGAALANSRPARWRAPLAFICGFVLLAATVEIVLDAAQRHSPLIPRSPQISGWLASFGGERLGYRVFLIAILAASVAYGVLLALVHTRARAAVPVTEGEGEGSATEGAGAPVEVRDDTLRERTVSRWAIGLVALLNLIVFVGPILISTDVFSYLAYARMGVVHGIDPYTHGPVAIVGDPVFYYVGHDWLRVATAYGPVYTLISYPLGALGLIGGLWGMKLYALLASAATLALTWRVARRRGRDRVFALLAVGANPLYVIYGLGGAHNDLIMLALMMAAVAFTLSDRDAAAGAAVVVGALVKATVAVLLPFMILARRRSAALYGALVALGLCALAGYLAFGIHGIDVVSALNRDSAFVSTDSFPNELAHLFGKPGVFPVDHDLLKAALVLIVLHLLWRTYRGYDWVAASGWALLAISVTSTWLLAWYILWPLPLAVITRDRRLLAATLFVQGLFIVHQTSPLFAPVS